jgi:hypothetical protein
MHHVVSKSNTEGLVIVITSGSDSIRNRYKATGLCRYTIWYWISSKRCRNYQYGVKFCSEGPSHWLTGREILLPPHRVKNTYEQTWNSNTGWGQLSDLKDAGRINLPCVHVVHTCSVVWKPLRSVLLENVARIKFRPTTDIVSTDTRTSPW